MIYKIAIPSYDRAELLVKKTINTLSLLLDNFNNVFIFVSDKEQELQYKNVLKEKGHIIIGIKGMKEIRNFITDYFDENEKILYLDDDIDGFIKKGKGNINKEDFDSFVQRGFQEAENNNTKLFGIYPISNLLFMKDNITTDLRYIVGCCYGVINDKEIKVTIDSGEDFERTILFYEKYGSVVRFNYIAPKTVYWRKKGGMAATRTIETMKISCDYLVEKYPTLCSLKIRKTGGLPNIKFKSIL